MGGLKNKFNFVIILLNFKQNQFLWWIFLKK